jgi:DNA-binding transcriptional regulator YiaG|tara:strand:- start:93 stop:371 length:279 start_codon:yes stop_codon:yes gene_type:complete
MKLNTQLSTILQRLSEDSGHTLTPSDMEIITNSPLMTETDVARCLTVSKELIRKWRSQGIELTYIRIGNSIRYHPLDVLQKIQVSKVHPISA